MKKIDMFCTSQAATAICLSMEQHSSSSPSPSTLLLSAAADGGAGGRFLDRHNPIIRDAKRIPKSLPPCTTSQAPISPKPRKNKDKNTPSDENEDPPKKSGAAIGRRSWSCTRPGEFLSPPGSTRYLLREKALSDSEATKVPAAEESLKFKDVRIRGEPPPSSSDSPDQVVVLRVSLHCRGCVKKLRKHLSRMEGLTSFNIDFMAKKVTVTGKVTPLEVLSSISKVKNAQLWSPTISSSFIPSLNINNLEIKN